MNTDAAKLNTQKFFTRYHSHENNSEYNKHMMEFVTELKTKPFDKDLKVDQVRLLSNINEPTFILITRIDGDNIWFIPFSNYEYPASHDEIIFSDRFPNFVRVLQVWNVRTWHRKFVEESWPLMPLNEEEIKRSFEAYFMIIEDAPEHLSNIIGATLNEVNKLDVLTLCEYKSKTLQKFAKIDADDIKYWETL